MRRSISSVSEMLPSLDDFVFEKDGEWQMDARLGKLIDHFGSRIALSIRQSIFQKKGVDAKLVKGFTKALAKDGVQSNPILAGLEGLGFNASDYLLQNPRIIEMIRPFLQNLGKNSPASTHSDRIGGYG